jgi:hypothetical protein
VEPKCALRRWLAAEHALFDHPLAACTAFFSGLKHEPHGARGKLAARLHALQQFGCAQQHGGVRVVAASVHLARHLGREVYGRSF